jgi:AcrR family transcriptional regulator
VERLTQVVRVASAQTRRKILDVALELFSTQGYDRTSLREISERLGFTKAALYYHFRAKEDILRALAGDLIEQFERIVEAGVNNPDRSLRARTQVLSEMVDLLLSNQATAVLLVSEKPPLNHTDLGERTFRVFRTASQALLPAAPTVEDRVRASAALAILQSVLDNLADVSCTLLRNIVMKLAVIALDRDCDLDRLAKHCPEKTLQAAAADGCCRETRSAI